MQHLKNLKIYTPDDEYSLFLMKEHSAEFFISEDGRDWYESQASFSPDTLKVAYDEAGIIRSISQDVSSIYPRDLSVVEFPATKANLRVTLGDYWFYKDGKLQQIRDYLADAETERNSRMADVTARIDWLEDAQKDSDISADEEKELTELRAYRTALRRLDLSAAPKINWPDAPA
ncbi:TPA: tail fiber assembly protein [Citrobacter werkmanii]|uniref:tail fiber assembly protein n=1 Tax=Citrobacter TaxID=544 RepID=UPI0010C93B84|nr:MULTISPECIES: tail fiber assembly protein [Citrobacter]MEB1054812.1 tail fiber assembly protein [Citrobacter portucalensis]TKU87407.1 tail fiber assembly protein [Citrobacter sp. wls708]